ncbi:DedA family protein [Nocardia sp. NPDC050712]|uniref:DedA family protein n=1 Tax=Nocardia sp. NPDC050712 TaxID=3155518 RepID=UPI00340501B4
MSPTGTAEIGGLAGWAVSLMERIGGPGAGLAIFLENLFPPVPSEVVLPLAGFAARLNHFSLVEAVVWTTIGSVLGAWCLYGLGAWLGHDRMRELAARVPLIEVDDIDRTAEWFARHGAKAVFFGRMVPLFRSFISIPAGTARMNFAMFTLFTLLGSLIWNCVFIGAGYLLGANWDAVEPYSAGLQYVVIAVVVVIVVRFVLRRLRRRRGNDRPGRGAAVHPPATVSASTSENGSD